MAFNCYMHERNIYKEKPDFSQIANDYPEFRKFAIPHKKGKFRIDFNDTNALRALTKILLKKDFDLNVEIPNGYLIPTVPQRLNYILWIEDLLTVLSKPSEKVLGIDIGTGPCAILSLLGSKKNSWHFVSTDTAGEAVQWANKNIENNDLGAYIRVTKVNKGTVLHNLMAENEDSYDFCVCNPPFFEDKDDIRKKSSRMKEKLELCAKKEEIFSEGGEASFVKQLLKDSIMFKDRVSLYSSMFGKKKSFIEILKELRNIEGVIYTKTEFCQGNTIRWGIAWTFLKEVNFEKIERPKPKKPKKAKPPLVHSISRKFLGKDDNILSMKEVLKDIKNILLELEIEAKIIKSAANFAEIEITSYKNTWSHQRRKRREQLKCATLEADKKCGVKDESLLSACEGKSDSGGVTSEGNEALGSFSASHSAVRCIVSKQEPSTANVTKSVGDHSDIVFADDPSQTSSNSISQKRKKDEEHVTLEADKKCEVKDESVLSACEGKSDFDGVTSEENKDSSTADHCIVSEQGPTTANETKSLFDHSDTVFADDPSQTPSNSASQKRKRDEEDPIDSNISKDPHDECILENTTAKRLKIAEDNSLSNVCKRKIELDTSPKKKMQLIESQSHEEEKYKNLQSTHQVKTFETVPLLYSILKLRTTKESILMDMNCPPECNRETMHQVFQLFKNKLG